MVQLFDIGPRGFHKGIAAATLSFTPLQDRAAVVRRIFVDAPSANDIWVVTTTGRELARFPIYTVGNQQMLGGSAANYPKNADLFEFTSTALDYDLIYPVPQGQTITVNSVGGATADITLEYTEHSLGDITPNMLNHPQGNMFAFPLFLVPPAADAGTVAREVDFASQIGPSWFPSMVGLQNLPAGFQLSIPAIFTEGAGVNTFSGSANHASVTDHLALDRNGMRLFTRDLGDGIPMVGPAAAAGSANTVYGSVNTPYPAFQVISNYSWQPFRVPLVLRGGDQYRWRLGLTGDATGGADYHLAVQALLIQATLQGLQI